MTKLKKFNKKEIDRKNFITIVGAFLIAGIILAGISYAVYQRVDEVLFINARVGQFETTSSDIELAMTLDGEDVDAPPSKGDYSVTVECDHADGTWNMDEWGPDIRNITSNRVKCNVSFATPAPTLSDISVTANKTDITLAYSITSTGEINKTCKYGTEENDLINEGTITDSGCTLDNLDRGVTYYYEVCVNSPKHEPVCKRGNSTTIAIAKPIVSNISASASTNSITLNYSITGENMTGYTCKYGTDTNYASSSTASASSCTLSGLSSGTTYYYQICGTNVSGTTCQTGSTKTSSTVNKCCTDNSSFTKPRICAMICHNEGICSSGTAQDTCCSLEKTGTCSYKPNGSACASGWYSC